MLKFKKKERRTMLFSNERIKELSFKIKQLIESSPISELEANIHALIQGVLTKMELVSREEFDIQSALLARTQQQLRDLEQKISALEQGQAQAQATESKK
jgi:ubiquinone biosynthesis accessory factor UbiK